MPAAAKTTPAPLVLAGHVPLVYLDANILLPEYLRSVFLDLADAGLIRVHWGEQILVEVRRNLLKPRFGKTPEAADKLLRVVADAFPDAVVLGSERLEAQFAGTTDPKDAHVAAGALKLSQSVHGGQSVVLVTSNMKHLPQTAFAGTSVRSARPGTFLKDLLAANPKVADILSDMLKRFKAPVVSREDLLTILDNSGCGVFAIALANAWGFSNG